MRKLSLLILLSLLLIAVFIINPGKPFLCNSPDKQSNYNTKKDADCGGMYLADSLNKYLNDTAYFNTNLEANALVIRKNKNTGIDKFRRRLFGDKVTNIEEVRKFACIDSAGINIQLEGGNNEGPEIIKLRIEKENKMIYVFMPNIILYHITENKP